MSDILASEQWLRLGLQKIQRQVDLTPAVQLLTGIAGSNAELPTKPVDHP